MNREVKSALGRAMTVAELRDLLEGLDDNMPVMFTCDYGDYHHTTQALPVATKEVRRISELHESAYSQSRVALNTDESEDEGAYCPKCDDEYQGMPKCPVCGTQMVGEDGEPWAGAEDENGGDVLILA